MVITSTDNKIIKSILDFKKKGKRSKSDLLFFEGLRLVEDILSTDAVIDKLLIKESDQDKYINLSNTYPYLILSDDVFKHISGTVNSQGIALLAHPPKFELHSQSKGSLYLAIDQVQDPGNLGTIIRTALAAGVEGIFLLKGTVDLYNEKTLRSTMGSIYKLPIYLDYTVDELKEFIEKEQLTPIKARANGKHKYNEIPKGKYIAFMGNEGNGISKEADEIPGLDVKIPLYGDIESLNVAVACGIILYGIRENL